MRKKLSKEDLDDFVVEQYLINPDPKLILRKAHEEKIDEDKRILWRLRALDFSQTPIYQKSDTGSVLSDEEQELFDRKVIHVETAGGSLRDTRRLGKLLERERNR